MTGLFWSFSFLKFHHLALSTCSAWYSYLCVFIELPSDLERYSFDPSLQERSQKVTIHSQRKCQGLHLTQSFLLRVCLSGQKCIDSSGAFISSSIISSPPLTLGTPVCPWSPLSLSVLWSPWISLGLLQCSDTGSSFHPRPAIWTSTVCFLPVSVVCWPFHDFTLPVYFWCLSLCSHNSLIRQHADPDAIHLLPNGASLSVL